MPARVHGVLVMLETEKLRIRLREWGYKRLACSDLSSLVTLVVQDLVELGRVMVYLPRLRSINNAMSWTLCPYNSCNLSS